MATPTRFPQDKMSRQAKFGTVVESCSKKAAQISPSTPYYAEKCKYGKVLGNFLIKLFDKDEKSARFLAQKNRKPFLISCFVTA